MTRFALRLPPVSMLACPACFATIENGLAPELERCNVCGIEFFNLSGLPCWFSGGMLHKRFWDNHLGLMQQNSVNNIANLVEQSQNPGLMPSVKQRLIKSATAHEQIAQSLSDLLTDAGLRPDIIPELKDQSPAGMMHYYELLLRDWAWDQGGSENSESENESAYRRLLQALESSTLNTHNLGTTLVLGAGAGRLSWDFHRRLQPSCTLALDNSPLLLLAAQRLIVQGQEWQLMESPANCQMSLPKHYLWTLSAPTANPENWYALAADAWQAPLKPASFDLIITPWFMDVNGRDAAQLIGLVAKLLKPEGYWVNTGPLLYGNSDLPAAQRYDHEEIAELLAMAGFELKYQQVEQTSYLRSPLQQRSRSEQVWTFCARAPAANVNQENMDFPPAWLLLPHLPIPNDIKVNAQDEPVLIQLLGLVDGHTSINHIGSLMAPNLDPGQDAVALVKTVFLEMLMAHPEYPSHNH